MAKYAEKGPNCATAKHKQLLQKSELGPNWLEEIIRMKRECGEQQRDATEVSSYLTY